MKKILSLLLAMAMLCSLAVSAAAEEPAADLSGSTIILHTNDVHGAVDGYAKAAALKETYEEMGAYVLLMDAGDFIQGDPAVGISEGANAIELMNLAGYDVAAPGNHEFDYGYDTLKKLEKAAEFPLLSANVQYKGKAAFDDNLIFTAPDGIKLGVFGLTTPESATKVHPGKIKDVTFLSGEELAVCAQEQVDELKAKGCDVIICLGHMGIDAASVGNRSVDLLEQVEGIDLFIDAHSHSTLADVEALVGEGCMVNDTILTSTGTKFENIGLAIIADGSLIATTIPTDELVVEDDKEVAALVKTINAEIEKEYGAVFAKTEVTLDGEREHVRSGETNLGDLITDAMVWGAEETGTEVDAAIINSGGIRVSIGEGNITKKDINTVLPFGNTLSIIQITGQQLLEALEASTYYTPEPAGAFPQVSGIEFTIDIGKPFDQGAQYPGSTYYAPNSIQRVSIQAVGGKAFDPQAVYTIATNDYLAADGDTYHAFGSAAVNYDLGAALDQVVMDYITEVLDGVVTEKAYGQSKGRAVILESLPFTDVAKDASYYDDVMYVYRNNIFKGFTDTVFGPTDTMTRGQMVTVLWRMSGSPEPAIENPFADVADNSAYAKAITWAYENKLTNGYSATTFAPGKAITRQQFLTILYNYAKYMEYDVSVGEDTNILSYADAFDVAEYAIPAMQWACGAGVVYDLDGYLQPTSPAPRYQVAEFLTAFCQKAA